MSKKVVSFLAIPPKHKRARYLRIRIGIIIFLLIIFLGGVAGFFIPFNALTLDVVELNQKKHTMDQNKKLLTKIRNMREKFFLLKGKVDTLSETRENLEGFIDIKKKVSLSDSSQKTQVAKMELDDIFSHLTETEAFFHKLAEKIKRNPSYINYVPVVRPVADEYVITAFFGQRKDPFTGDMKWHNGVDFSSQRETPVIATAAGTVDKVEKHSYWGRRIRIRHRFGFSTIYAHLGTVKVAKGKNVTRGEVIATIGVSGLTTGPHLHYEIKHRDSYVDPELYFFPDPQIVAAAK